MLRIAIPLFCLLLTLGVSAGHTRAQNTMGSETGLPLPRFISLKAGEANLRAGPGQKYPIRWIYKRRHLPVRVHDEHGHWRAVTDPWGGEGWLHKSLLSGRRTVMVMKELSPLHREPRADSAIVLYAQRRVIGTLERCEGIWCRLIVDGRAGWMLAERLYGN